jgi:hypothetical protein
MGIDRMIVTVRVKLAFDKDYWIKGLCKQTNMASIPMSLDDLYRFVNFKH